MVEPNFRLCSSSGLWIGLEPECRVLYTCARLSIDYIPITTYSNNNGPVDQYRAEYPVGTFAEFKCPHNMCIEGESLLTCIGQNQWDYLIPKCVI